jgi:hypothetical protein
LTAGYVRDGACAVGLVGVANGHIVERAIRLIRPAGSRFIFTGRGERNACIRDS